MGGICRYFTSGSSWKRHQGTIRIDDFAIISQHAKAALNFYVGNQICKETIAFSIKVLINAMRLPLHKQCLEFFGDKIPLRHTDSGVTALLNDLPMIPGNYLFSPIGISNNDGKLVAPKDPPMKMNPTLVLDSNTNARLRVLMNEKYYADWYNRIWKMLDSSDAKIIQKSVNYLGFLYLNLMRLMKTSSSLQYHITKNVSINFKNFYKISDFSAITPPPHPDFYQTFGIYFKKTGPNCCDVMCYLIEAYEESKEILEEACLKELRFTGLGTIKWFYEASSHLKRETNDFLKTIEFAASEFLSLYELCDIKLTIKRVNEYEIQRNKDNSTSIEYCRLFRDSALCNLAVKQNKLFVAIMIYLLHSGGDLSIFNITQLKCIGEKDKQRASRIAASIIRQR